MMRKDTFSSAGVNHVRVSGYTEWDVSLCGRARRDITLTRKWKTITCIHCLYITLKNRELREAGGLSREENYYKDLYECGYYHICKNMIKERII